MKRSEINRIIREFETLLREHQFELPPYLSFTPEQWKERDMNSMRFVIMVLGGM